MHQHQETITCRTRGRGLYELTADLRRVVAESGVGLGQVTAFCRHTSASLVIQENADPSAGRDLLAWLERLAPDGDPAYTHTAEGPDDMPSHLRAAVTRSAETIPVRPGSNASLGGEPVLGTWQGLYLVEHRFAAHAREVVVHVIGTRTPRQ